MKKYSRFFWILTALLVVAVLMIACGKEDPLPENPNTETSESQGTQGANGDSNTLSSTPTTQEELDWDSLVEPDDSTGEPEDADPEPSESTSDSESDTAKGGLIEGGIVDDSGEHFGEILTGTPGTMPHRN